MDVVGIDLSVISWTKLESVLGVTTDPPTNSALLAHQPLTLSGARQYVLICRPLICISPTWIELFAWPDDNSDAPVQSSLLEGISPLDGFLNGNNTYLLNRPANANEASFSGKCVGVLLVTYKYAETIIMESEN